MSRKGSENKDDHTEMSQKAQRKENEKLREHFETSNLKPDTTPSNDAPRPNGDYESGEKRVYDRHSGTGEPAFAHTHKKDGHGHGNIGNIQDDELVKEGKNIVEESRLKQEEEDAETLNALNTAQEHEKQAAEAPKDIITLDKYAKEKGVTFGLENK